MTAEETRDLELNYTLVTERDRQQYDQIMRLVAEEASSEQPKRYIEFWEPVTRKVLIKLKQDHFDISTSDKKNTISWELTNTQS